MASYRAQIEWRNVDSAEWEVTDGEPEYGISDTAGKYGRRLLSWHLAQNPHLTGKVRVRVWVIYDTDSGASASLDCIALIDDPTPVPLEIVAIEAETEEVLRNRRALKLSVEQLKIKLHEARKIGHRESHLAALALPALACEYL
ncbi:hypothetical protein AB0E08_35505 [Streptomyces sp. NPDC048281]|uniref:hypothetical protein n=1 Tax=Streptomyces sp. NPDC048281 TaxID=3154715 RepID=UPI003442C0B4